MQFVRLGQILSVSRITGPHHNLLQIQLGSDTQCAPICEALPPNGKCKHEPIDEAEVITCVLNGVRKANMELGTNYAVTYIRYVKNDTKPESVYGFLAEAIIKHLEREGEFTPGGA